MILGAIIGTFSKAMVLLDGHPMNYLEGNNAKWSTVVADAISKLKVTMPSTIVLHMEDFN